MNIPQIMMVFYLVVLTLGGLVLNGKPKTGEYQFSSVFIEVLLLFAILYAGGFWN